VLAAALYKRSTLILVERKSFQGRDRTGVAKLGLMSMTPVLRSHARAIFYAKADDAEASNQGFELAQWALQSSAADALAQMSVRVANGPGALATLVREGQDLLFRRQGEMRDLDKAIGQGDTEAANKARVAVAALDERLDVIDGQLRADFKEYSDLADPKPLTIKAIQELLRPDEALVAFLDIPQYGRLSEETLTWVLTRQASNWRSIPLGTHALTDRVAALRCGLDQTLWRDALSWAEETEAKKLEKLTQLARRKMCLELVGHEPAYDGNGEAIPSTLPFDTVRAHALYRALLGQVDDLIRGKLLFIVPSGPLTQLPFHVLVTEPPDPGMARGDASAWLAKSNAIAILPAVSSLKALREHAKTSRATKPLIGFGNPLLDGDPVKRPWEAQWAKIARNKRVCQQAPLLRTARLGGGMNIPQQRGGIVNLDTIRGQVPLPETADELCAVARSLAVPESEIRLGARATEGELKRVPDLDRAGRLRRTIGINPHCEASATILFPRSTSPVAAQ
jgi:hypothetical protein